MAKELTPEDNARGRLIRVSRINKGISQYYGEDEPPQKEAEQDEEKKTK